MSANFFNLFDEVNGDAPRFQRSNAGATVEQRTQPSKAPKPQQRSTAKDQKYWDAKFAKAPPRIIKASATRAPARTPRDILRATKAKAKARSTVAKKPLGCNKPMHGRPGVTIGQHLAEYEERNKDGYTFDQLVHLLLFGERAL